MTKEIIEAIKTLEEAMGERGILEEYLDGSSSLTFCVTEKKTVYFDFDADGKLEDVWMWENK